MRVDWSHDGRAWRGQDAGLVTVGRDVRRAYLARLEVVLDAVLKAFSFGLQRRDNQTVPHEVGGVADSLAGTETTEETKCSVTPSDTNNRVSKGYYCTDNMKHYKK